jgi:hypothetical protein
MAPLRRPSVAPYCRSVTAPGELASSGDGEWRQSWSGAVYGLCREMSWPFVLGLSEWYAGVTFLALAAVHQ